MAGRCRNLPWALLWGVVGVVAFWLPCMVIHWIAGEGFGGRHVLAESVASPLVTVAGLYLFWAKAIIPRIHPLAIWAAMTIGIWLAGPFAMFATDVPMGSSVLPLGALAAAMTAIFPVGTFMMATYHGELGPLILIPMVLLGAITPLCDHWRGPARVT